MKEEGALCELLGDQGLVRGHEQGSASGGV
jgi:hypothetical protein